MYGIIYLVTNKKNGKQYVGQTLRSLAERWSEHVRKAKAHYNHYLGNAILRYGADNFSVEEIAQAESQERLDLLEITAIEEFETMRPNGYNLTKGGLGGIPDEETREKIRQSKLGEKNPNYQKVWTEEERQSLSNKCPGEATPSMAGVILTKPSENCPKQRGPGRDTPVWVKHIQKRPKPSSGKLGRPGLPEHIVRRDMPTPRIIPASISMGTGTV